MLAINYLGVTSGAIFMTGERGFANGIALTVGSLGARRTGDALCTLAHHGNRTTGVH